MGRLKEQTRDCEALRLTQMEDVPTRQSWKERVIGSTVELEEEPPVGSTTARAKQTYQKMKRGEIPRPLSSATLRFPAIVSHWPNSPGS